jgi:hypothetical protein
MSHRDDFTQKTKRQIAMRASWLCSFTECAKSTVGPSEESSEAVSLIGKAAHICGAASGPGSRRYAASMTPAERKHISNAIWLCADHADLIDRDEKTFKADDLRAMKRAHETFCSQVLRLRTGHDMGTGLLAIGPDIVCTADVPTIAEDSWTLHLKHFVDGDVHDIAAFIAGFAKAAAADRYILSNELGDGRLLSKAPVLSKQPYGYSLLCPVAPVTPRAHVKDLGSDMAIHPETHDIYLDGTGDIARVSGLEYLPQKVQSLLSMQRGENVFAPKAGMRFFEYFEAFNGDPWLPLLMKLDIVRMAAIPYGSTFQNREDTPLRCVKRVCSFELLSDTPAGNRLPVRVDFDVEGLGRWQQDLSIYMPTREQMDERARILAERPSLAQG